MKRCKAVFDRPSRMTPLAKELLQKEVYSHKNVAGLAGAAGATDLAASDNNLLVLIMKIESYQICVRLLQNLCISLQNSAQLTI